MNEVNREKLLAAVQFFATNTINCRLTKMMKLLYFLDFMHYEQTGLPVTGLAYYAWQRGPVPRDFYSEVRNDPQPDLRSKVTLHNETVGEHDAVRFSAVGQPDLSIFTRREIQILEQLARQYMRARAQDMVEASHLEHLPWHQVWEVEGREMAEIPYDFAVDEAIREPLKEFIDEQEELSQFIAGYRAD
jgi:uncharacterized phage-associated protein